MLIETSSITCWARKVSTPLSYSIGVCRSQTSRAAFGASRSFLRAANLVDFANIASENNPLREREALKARGGGGVRLNYGLGELFT